MNIIWTQTAWSQYVEWQSKDKSMVKKINENRLVYNLDSNGNLVIFACTGHYED